MKRHREQGFVLLELIVGLGLISILLMSACFFLVEFQKGLALRDKSQQEWEKSNSDF